MVNEIKNLVLNYLCLKKECVDRGFEGLYDVLQIFINEVYEMNEVCTGLEKIINDGEEKNNYSEDEVCKEVISFYEEFIVNELADLLLTSSRLIQQFELEEPFAEMLQYKYERQKSRELKRIKNVENELLK